MAASDYVAALQKNRLHLVELSERVHAILQWHCSSRRTRNFAYDEAQTC
jgi:hypothetical protein